MEYQWLIAQLKENENTHYLSADYLPRIIAKIEKKSLAWPYEHWKCASSKSLLMKARKYSQSCCGSV